MIDLDKDLPSNIKMAFESSKASNIKQEQEEANITPLAGEEEEASDKTKAENKGVIKMDNLEISKAVKQEVEKLLAAKDASAQIEKTIAGLNKNVSDLTVQVESAKAETVTVASELETAKA